MLVDSNKILEKTFSKTMERTEKNQQDVLLAWSKLKVGRSLSEKKNALFASMKALLKL